MESHQKYLLELTEAYEEKLNIEQTSQKLISDEKETLIVLFNDNKNDTEEDAEIEIEELKAK